MSNPISRTITCIAFVTSALLSACTAGSAGIAGATFSGEIGRAWPVEGGNPSRNREVSSSIVPPLVLKGTYPVEGDTQFTSPPVVANGLLIADSARRLSALGLGEGKEEWFIHLAGSYLSPVIAENLVIARVEAGDEGFLVALDAKRATIAWQHQFPKVGSSYDNIGGHVTAPVVVDETVFVGAAKTMTANHLLVRWDELNQIWTNSLSAFFLDPDGQAADVLPELEAELTDALQRIMEDEQ